VTKLVDLNMVKLMKENNEVQTCEYKRLL